MQTIKLTKSAVDFALKALKRGVILIAPTDTVYGFLADASNLKAVKNIFKIKKRSKLKAFPLFVKDITMAKKIAEIDNLQEKFLKKYWPGRVTFVLKRKKKSPFKVYGVKKDTIALRIPNNDFLRRLLNKINKPLVQTSVNISGEPPLKKVKDIENQFRNSKYPILLINGGDLKKNARPSKIIDLTGSKFLILRK